ncbi:GL23274 [Drosophila persimilis]|uniref:GL23274 n=2 Tax=Drosophila persimilis TaxID=7234 RepID=B4G4Y9_DROPE|nr:GL23274 [Drosophila persimilis]
MANLPPLEINADEAAQLGYMPNRDSFEREYDPTAEQLISNITLSSEDTEVDVMLKLAHVDIYTRRLRERARRKRMVRDYQLVSNFFRNRNYALHQGLTKEQKEFRDRFRVYAQFYTCNEYERLLASLEREKELRIRQSELYRYRYNGLTKIEECVHFEQHAAMASHRSTGPYGHGKTDLTQPSNGNLRPPSSSLLSPQPNLRKAEMSSGAEASSSSIAPRNTHHTVDPTCSDGLSHSRNYLDNCRVSSAATTLPTTTTGAGMGMGTVTGTSLESGITATTGAISTATTMAAQANLPTTSAKGSPQLQQQQQHPPLSKNNQLLHPNEVVGSSGSHNTSEEQAVPSMSFKLRSQLEELKHLPQPLGSNLLTHNEKDLCKKLNITPTTYLSLKTVCLSGAPSLGSPMEISLRKFFIKCGWLSH